MKKLIIITTLGSLVFGTSLDRRVELLENAVVKLIDENKKLKEKMQAITTVSKVQYQAIVRLDNKTKANKKAINKLNQKIKDNNSTFYAKIKTTMLNVREKPTTKSRILGVLKKGNIIKIKESIKNGKTIWYKVGNNKFISSNYTNLIKGE